ncbi:AAA family ATPase [Sandarakinorhabdus sp.]|uniref:AAA family ATPase n=1 Tax=Sandarakinorhabdus sp. TaxID=1916663 RepID=UPI00286E995A|nr:AAA family ATPase [Sandarakinorhabdus sp.]
MYHVAKIDVHGFWGRYRVSTPIFPSVTFFIGENGSGKTTLINLIAACLAADFLALDKLAFRKVEITLISTSDRRRKPKIIVEKNLDSKSGIESIEYRIYSSSKSEPITFSLDDIEEQRMLRRRPNAPSFYMRQSKRTRDLTSALSGLISMVWLSIHRNTLLNEADDRRTPDRGYDSTVDMKLNELSARLSRYYSSLVSMRDQSVRAFQEFTFMSLLDERDDARLFSLVKEIDIEEQRAALVEAFERLGVKKEKFSSKANRYFSTLKSVKSSKDKGLTVQQVQAMVVLQQIQQITKKWTEEKARQDDIFKDISAFMTIMNSLLKRKSLRVTDSFEICTINDKGDDVSVYQLSSGEKQLLILLGEALLQEHRSCIYIADEPELSLHLKWQEKIVPSILQLNDNAQLIVATHSPDIIGPYGSHIIRMDDLLVEEQ